jgi:glycosyltransferase involved in cell wall biosynthesis
MTESAAATPVFTVVIATYNWSSALYLALQSVLAQTFDDFEVLVVGDGCSDDSGEVVTSFGDARLQWHNLPFNHGSQWAPNNHALSLARGRYIAYLGHDDLWWPTHLQRAKECLVDDTVDVVAAATLMYGPEESGMHAITGFFPHGIFSARHFFVPSSMVHKRELGIRIGGWRSPEEALVAVDVDFVRRCHEAAARIVGTEDFTVFKFNAAWRRDAYRTKDPQQQRDFLARMKREGEGLRLQALTRALRAASEDRLLSIQTPWDASVRAAVAADVNHQFKGSRKATHPRLASTVDGRRRYAPTSDYAGFEWHALEHHPTHGDFRWTGPSTRSSIVLPERLTEPLAIRMQVIACITEEVFASLTLEVNGEPIALSKELEGPKDAPYRILLGRIDPERLHPADREELRLELQLAQTWRPSDLHINADRRWLGIAVGWTEVGPVHELDMPSVHKPRRWLARRGRI